MEGAIIEGDANTAFEKAVSDIVNMTKKEKQIKNILRNGPSGNIVTRREHQQLQREKEELLKIHAELLEELVLLKKQKPISSSKTPSNTVYPT